MIEKILFTDRLVLRRSETVLFWNGSRVFYTKRRFSESLGCGA